MARATVNATAITSMASNGTNLTDATFTTLSTGAGNGIEFTWDDRDLLILKNDTGGPAAVTVKVPALASVTALGGTVTDSAVTVAAGKTRILKLPQGLKQSDGKVYVDCDIALKALVLRVG